MKVAKKVAFLTTTSTVAAQILTDPIPEPEAKYDSEDLIIIP